MDLSWNLGFQVVRNRRRSSTSCRRSPGGGGWFIYRRESCGFLDSRCAQRTMREGTRQEMRRESRRRWKRDGLNGDRRMDGRNRHLPPSFWREAVIENPMGGGNWQLGGYFEFNFSFIFTHNFYYFPSSPRKDKIHFFYFLFKKQKNKSAFVV